MRVLGLDIGSKRIGVAISDSTGVIATPLTVVSGESRNKAIEEITALVAEHEAELIVAGLPLNMDGTKGPQAEKILKFVEQLKKKVSVGIETWDERLSTKAVTKVLIEGGTRRADRKKSVDKLSAAYILQGYLDRQNKDIQE